VARLKAVPFVRVFSRAWKTALKVYGLKVHALRFSSPAPEAIDQTRGEAQILQLRRAPEGG